MLMSLLSEPVAQHAVAVGVERRGRAHAGAGAFVGVMPADSAGDVGPLARLALEDAARGEMRMFHHVFDIERHRTGAIPFDETAIPFRSGRAGKYIAQYGSDVFVVG